MAKPLSAAEKELKRTNPLLQNLKIETDDQIDAFRNLVRQSAELSAELADLNEDLENLGDKFSLLKSNARAAASNLKNTFAGLQADIAGIEDAVKGTASAFNSLAARVNTSLRKSTGFVEEYNEGLLDSKDIEKELKKLKLEQLDIQSLYKDDVVGNSAALQAELAGYTAIIEQQEKALKKQLEFNKRIDFAVGLTGNLAKGFQKIPVLGDVLDLQSFNAEMRKTAKNAIDLEKSFVGFRVLGSAVKSLSKEAVKLFTDPVVNATALLGILKGLYENGVKFNVESTKIARNYGMSLEAAKGMYSQTSKLLENTKSEFLTRASIVQAQAELNNEFGTAVDFNEELIDGQVRLTDGLKLSVEESTKLTSLALRNNTTQQEVVKAITKENKGLLSNKKVLSEVAKTSGQLAAFYGNNPAALAKAVVQANKLGMSLEQTKNTTSKLLDFESSIQSQMEAEVLLGRTLDLSRARGLALEGKTAEAAEEMLKNVGGISEFQSMNRIQQEAIANAMGMSADELATTLTKQKELSVLGAKERAAIDKLRREGQGERADQLEKKLLAGDTLDLAQQHLDVQESMSKSVEKLKDAFSSLLEGPMSKVAETIASMAKGLASFANTGLGKVIMGISLASVGLGAIWTLIKKAKTAVMGGKDQNDGSPDRPWYVKITNKIAQKTKGLVGGVKDTFKSIGGFFKKKKQAPQEEGEEYTGEGESGEDILRRTTGAGRRYTGRRETREVRPGQYVEEPSRSLPGGTLPGPETTPAQTISEMFEQQAQAPAAAPRSLAGQVEALKRENPGMTSAEALKQIRGTATESAPPELPSVTPDLTREVAQTAPGKRRGFFGRMFKGRTAGKIGSRLGKLGRGAGNLFKSGMRSGALQGIASLALSSYMEKKAEAGEEPSALTQGASTLLENSGTISDLAQFIPKPGAGATPTVGVSAAPVTPTPALPTVAPATPTPALAPKPVASPVVKSTATQVEALKRANPGMTSKEALARIKSSPTGAVGKEIQAASTIGKEAQIASAAGKEVGLLGRVGGFFGKTFGGIGKTLGKGFGVVKNIFKSPIAKGFGKALGPIMAVAGSVMSVMSEINSAKERQAAGESVNTGNLGKKIVQGAAYPIANLATNLIPGVGQAISIADGILGAFGYSPIKWLTDNLIDLVPDDAFSGLGDLALGNKSAGAPAATPAVANTIPSKPKLAAGGVVTKGGVAEVDPGEVYLGKSTRDSFSELVKDTKTQTTLISDSKNTEAELLRQSQSSTQLIEKLIAQSSIVKDLGKETDRTSFEKISEAVSKTFTASITPVRTALEKTPPPTTPAPTLTESTVRELQATATKTEKSATAVKESKATTVVDSKQSLDALLAAIKEQTALLAAIKDKRLVIEADKLAYATSKATVMSYGNVLNPNSRTR